MHQGAVLAAIRGDENHLRITSTGLSNVQRTFHVCKNEIFLIIIVPLEFAFMNVAMKNYEKHQEKKTISLLFCLIFEGKEWKSPRRQSTDALND